MNIKFEKYSSTLIHTNPFDFGRALEEMAKDEKRLQVSMAIIIGYLIKDKFKENESYFIKNADELIKLLLKKIEE